ncbi:MAG: dihydropteroate synthase [Sphingobacteriales bacterium]|nr:dihydropteroate synthase [Sphingobacteriales bacterium]
MQNFTFNCRGKLLTINKPIVMGILNVTPDSFFDGGNYVADAQLIMQVEKMLSEGAAMIDIGGMSSRPGASMVSAEEELQRVIPAIKIIIREFPDIVISIDTFRSRVVKEAVEQGAMIVNDISGGTEDEKMFEIVADLNCPFILMHLQGGISNMHQIQHYNNLLPDMMDYFIAQTKRAKMFGIKDVILDVGFGFSKTLEQNYYLLKHLKVFEILGIPILTGLSRKSMLYRLLETTPENALNATTAVHMIALQNGAAILRAHDVKEAMECIKIYEMMNTL